MKNIEKEIWKDIDGYEGLYQVSNFGNVKSLPFITNNRNGNCLKKEIILKGRNNGYGYLAVVLYKNKVRKSIKVHRLVALAFIHNPEKKPQVNHINGIKTDNKAENLEWVTSSENSIHALKIGLQKARKGVENNKSKFSEEDVLKIRENKENLSVLELSIKYNVYKSTISSIIKRKTWKHI